MIASRRTVLAALAAGALTGCDRPGSLASSGRVASATPAAAAGSRAPRTVRPAIPPAAPVLTRAQVVARYGHLRPHTWGFGGPEVVRDLPTSRRVIALTFDACGGPGGSGYDQALIDFLRRREVQRRFSLTPAGSTPTRPPSASWPPSRCSRSPTTAPGTCPVGHRAVRLRHRRHAERRRGLRRGSHEPGQAQAAPGRPAALVPGRHRLLRRRRGTDRHRHGRSPRQLLRQRRRGSHLHTLASPQHRYRRPRRFHRDLPHEPPRERHSPGHCRRCPLPAGPRVPLRPPLRRTPLICHTGAGSHA